MAERPINLNKARKARAKQAAKETADRNAVIHGLPKSARSQARAEAERARRLHEGTQRAPKDSESAELRGGCLGHLPQTPKDLDEP